MSRWAVLGLGLCFAALGCQSYEDGVEVICEAPQACEECAQAPQAAWSADLTAYIEDHLNNEDAQDLFRSLSAMPPQARAQALREAANATRLRDCQLADALANAVPR